jgi:hypothetical protein
MPKLRLDVEALEVQSFLTADERMAMLGWEAARALGDEAEASRATV